VTPHQIVVVLLRLLALIWLLFTLTHMYGLFVVYDSGEGVGISRPIVLFSAAFQVFVCFALWFFPSTIAANLLRSEQPAHEPAPTRPLVEWQALGVICIGLWALAQAIPDSIYWLTYYAMLSSSDLSIRDLDPEQKATALSTVAQLAIGLWLVLGAKGLAAAIFRIRAAGISKEPPPAP
jgi:hypothetical protein